VSLPGYRCISLASLIIPLPYIGKDKQDFYEQIPVILRELLYRLNDENPSVVKAAHSAFTSLSKHVPAEELVKHIEFVRNLIASIVSEARHRKGGVGDGEFLLPGFNMPKGKSTRSESRFLRYEEKIGCNRHFSWGQH
jgi:hypothetical protein